MAHGVLFIISQGSVNL